MAGAATFRMGLEEGAGSLISEYSWVSAAPVTLTAFCSDRSALVFVVLLIASVRVHCSYMNSNSHECSVTFPLNHIHDSTHDQNDELKYAKSDSSANYSYLYMHGQWQASTNQLTCGCSSTYNTAWNLWLTGINWGT